MRRHRRIWIPALSVAVVVALSLLAVRGLTGTQIPRGDRVEAVLSVPPRLVPVEVPEGARILRLTRPVGTPVAAGDTVAMLDTDALQRARLAQLARARDAAFRLECLRSILVRRGGRGHARGAEAPTTAGIDPGLLRATCDAREAALFRAADEAAELAALLADHVDVLERQAMAARQGLAAMDGAPHGDRAALNRALLARLADLNRARLQRLEARTRAERMDDRARSAIRRAVAAERDAIMRALDRADAFAALLADPRLTAPVSGRLHARTDDLSEPAALALDTGSPDEAGVRLVLLSARPRPWREGTAIRLEQTGQTAGQGTAVLGPTTITATAQGRLVAIELHAFRWTGPALPDAVARTFRVFADARRDDLLRRLLAAARRGVRAGRDTTAGGIRSPVTEPDAEPT